MMSLFDAQAGFGGAQPGQPWVPCVEELLGHMERLSIGRALVRTEFEEMDTDPMYSNQVLYAACAAHEIVVPCPTVLPTGHGDVPPEREQIGELIANGSGAAVLRPKQDDWSTAEWCAGALLGLLEERRVPVLCRSSAFEFDTIADLALRHPKLPIVLFHVGFRSQRMLVSLMRAFDNVHLSIGSPYSVHLGVESMAGHVGPERLLFGTGFPYAEPMASVTMLTYSDLSDADRQLIGSGNVERLIGGIQR